MNGIWLLTLGSVFLVSLISFVGALTLSFKADKLRKILIHMVSFSAGALFGDAFLHLYLKSSKKQASLSESQLHY